VSGLWGGTRFCLVHGAPLDPLCGSVNVATAREAELEALFGAVSAEVIVVGHTHVPAIRRFGQRWIISPGSLGQPRYGVPDATYAVWEDGDLRIRHLHYNRDATARKLRLMGAVGALSAEVSEQLADLLETGLVKEAQP
jgi:protein phosphatase